MYLFSIYGGFSFLTYRHVLLFYGFHFWCPAISYFFPDKIFNYLVKFFRSHWNSVELMTNLGKIDIFAVFNFPILDILHLCFYCLCFSEIFLVLLLFFLYRSYIFLKFIHRYFIVFVVLHSNF